MTLSEVTKALGTCYMKFYSNKMREIFALEDGFKKTYLMSALMLMMKDHGSSFDFEGSDMDSMKGHMNHSRQAKQAIG